METTEIVAETVVFHAVSVVSQIIKIYRYIFLLFPKVPAVTIGFATVSANAFYSSRSYHGTICDLWAGYCDFRLS